MSWAGINVFVLLSAAIIYGYIKEDKVIAFEKKLLKKLKGEKMGGYTITDVDDYTIIMEVKK